MCRTMNFSCVLFYPIDTLIIRFLKSARISYSLVAATRSTKKNCRRRRRTTTTTHFVCGIS